MIKAVVKVVVNHHPNQVAKQANRVTSQQINPTPQFILNQLLPCMSKLKPKISREIMPQMLHLQLNQQP